MDSTNASCHPILANYFSSLPLFFDGDLQKKPNIRKCVELPFQQTKAGLWDEVTDTLCNLDFIQAKAVAKMTYNLVEDFNNVLEVIPDNSKNIREEKVRQSRMEKYTRDLIACAKSEITIGELQIPESITPWSQDKIDKEIDRIKNNPTWSDRLKDYINFLGQEAFNLQNYSREFPHFTIQQAWNYANDGLVANDAEHTDPEVLMKLLSLNQSSRPYWNPFPQVLKILKGHSGAVTSVCITPNGKRAISSSYDKTCIYWDLETGQELKLLKAHSDKVAFVCMTPDGKYAFTGSYDKTCIFWNIETGQVLKTFIGHSLPILSVALTPDGRYAVSGSLDDTCIIWDIESGHHLKTLPLNSANPYYCGVNAVSISPNGKFVLSCSRDFPYTLILWDTKTSQRIKEFTDHQETIKAVHFLPDDKFVVSCSDNICILWDLEKGRALTKLQGHKCVSITPDKKLIVTSSPKHTSILLDTETGHALKTLERHADSIDITPDGKNAFSGSEDNSCIFWEIQISQKKKKHSGHTDFFNTLIVSADGKYAVSGSYDEKCILWDMETGQILNSLTGFLGRTSLLMTHDGKYAIAYGEYDRTFAVWDLINGSTLEIQAVHTGTIRFLCVIPDGKHIIWGSDDKTCKLREIENDKTLKTLAKHTSIINALSITPDGKFAVSGSSDQTCILWDLCTGEDLSYFTGHNNRITYVKAAPDGKFVLSGSDGELCMLWSLKNCEILRTLGENSEKFDSIIFTPDGKHALSNSFNNTCILWDLKTGLALETLSKIDFNVRWINITPDGKNAVAISNNNNCIIWNLKSGKILKRYIGPISLDIVALHPKGVVIGLVTGEIILLCINREILCPGPGIVTIRLIWDFENNVFLEPSSDCPFCGNRFSPPNSVLTTINEITEKTGLKPEQSPCLELPDEAWEDPGLLDNCPKCGAELKFNPFIAGGD